jgi:excisionase family DNA binding protein
MKPDGQEKKVWMSRAEVARLLEMSPVTIGRWASEGKLPYAVTLGGRRRYRRADVTHLVEQLDRVSRVTPRRHRRR